MSKSFMSENQDVAEGITNSIQGFKIIFIAVYR
jgi:hypothetical protein